MRFFKFMKDKRGQTGAIATVIPLVLVFGLAVVIAILMVTVSANVYTTADPWENVTEGGNEESADANTISTDINSIVENSFSAYTDVIENLPLLAIIAVALVVLFAVAGFMRFGAVGRGGGAL